MNSKKVQELKNWLESKVRPIDLPRDFSEDEVSTFIEIAELEVLGDIEKLNEKVEEFKLRYNRYSRNFL